MDLQALKRNPTLIEAGEWVSDIPGMEALRLRVRGLSSKPYQAKLARLSRAVPKGDRQRDGTLEPETAIKVMGEAAAETLLLDWSGLTESGQAVPYDASRAKELLTNPEYRPFLDAVIWAAQVVDNARADETEDLAKNSQTPSAGTSKKAAA